MVFKICILAPLIMFTACKLNHITVYILYSTYTFFLGMGKRYINLDVSGHFHIQISLNYCKNVTYVASSIQMSLICMLNSTLTGCSIWTHAYIMSHSQNTVVLNISCQISPELITHNCIILPCYCKLISLINEPHWVCKYLSPAIPDLTSIIQTCSPSCLPTHQKERVASVPSTHHLAPTSVYRAHVSSLKCRVQLARQHTGTCCPEPCGQWKKIHDIRKSVLQLRTTDLQPHTSLLAKTQVFQVVRTCILNNNYLAVVLKMLEEVPLDVLKKHDFIQPTKKVSLQTVSCVVTRQEVHCRKVCRTKMEEREKTKNRVGDLQQTDWKEQHNLSSFLKSQRGIWAAQLVVITCYSIWMRGQTSRQRQGVGATGTLCLCVFSIVLKKSSSLKSNVWQ